jgi:hypothetical protein
MSIGAASVRDPGFRWLNPTLWGEVQRPARRRLELFIGKFCRLLEYLDKHVSGQLAGLGVLV